MLNKFTANLVSKGSLTKKIKYNFANPLSKRKPLSKDLDHYDLVIIGSNIGGILSTQWDALSHGHFPTMVCFDNPINQQNQIRTLYEQQRAKKQQYLMASSMAMNQFTAHSAATGVDLINPEENYIIMNTGKKISYNHLVIASGLQENVNAISGLEDAWKDGDHPVFCNKDHPTWRSAQHKYTKYIYNFTGGNAFYCIPPYPFAGEVDNYNFFLSDDVWTGYKNHAKLSPKHKMTIMNANEKFVQHNTDADLWFKEELARRNIDVEYNQNLISIDKNTQKATFENVKTKERKQSNYSNLYTMMPSKPSDLLVKSKLVDEKTQYLLDVCPQTLRSTKYKNIFGLGDICNTPTTKTFFSAYYQVHHLRENLNASMEGKPMEYGYDGSSKALVQLGQNKVTFITHDYEKMGQYSLIDKSGGPLSILRYHYWDKVMKSTFEKLYRFKSYGPPYYKLTKIMQKLGQYPNKLATPVETPAQKGHGHGHEAKAH